MPKPSRTEFEARVFKTSRFAKAAGKARISDTELCEAMAEVMKGQCDDLGGGVFKKRLNKNMHRSIILAKGKKLWVYEDIFAKKDLANIEDDDLADFRILAKAYEDLTDQQLRLLLRDHNFVEIYDGNEV
jgi:hypothetical protein